MRTIVDLPAEQIEALKQISQRSRLSHAELMRQAVAEYLERHNPDREDAAFGLWQERGREGVACQQRLRDEWES